MSFRDFQTTPPTPGIDPPDGCAPTWLLNPNGLAWLGGMGDVKDGVAGWAKEAVKARFASLGPVDALAVLGEERGLPRGPSESTETYRARLSAAWDAWQWAGTPYGLLTALKTAGYTAKLQTQAGNEYTLISLPTGDPATDVAVASLGGGFDLAFNHSWSQCAVIVTTPFPSSWGGVAQPRNSGDAQLVKRLVELWKPGHVFLARLGVLAGDGTYTNWLPPMWDDGVSKWDDANLKWDDLI